MPIVPDPAIIVEQQKSDQRSPFLFLFEFPLLSVADESLRVARNRQDVTWNGHVYRRANVTLGGFEQGEDEDAATEATIELALSDTIRSILAANDDLDDHHCIVTVVHADHLSANLSVRPSAEWEVMESELFEDRVVLTVGLPSLNEREIPIGVWSRDRCGNVLGDWICRYPKDLFTDAQLSQAGVPPRKHRTCDLTFEGKNGCMAHRAFAQKLGIQNILWPRVFRGQRGIPRVRQ